VSGDPSFCDTSQPVVVSYMPCDAHLHAGVMEGLWLELGCLDAATIEIRAVFIGVHNVLRGIEMPCGRMDRWCLRRSEMGFVSIPKPRSASQWERG